MSLGSVFRPVSPCRSLTFTSRRRTIELAAAVKNTFEPVLLLHLYPRSSIDIYLQILENDGCESLIHCLPYMTCGTGEPLRRLLSLSRVGHGSSCFRASLVITVQRVASST